MPKGKKKKQRRPQIPALSWGDKVIYHMLMVLSPAVGFGLLALGVKWQAQIAAEEGALAVRSNPLGSILLFLYLFYHTVLFLQLKQEKVHLFGRRDITYGPPRWREAYPIFRPHPKVTRDPDGLRSLRRRWTVYLTLWAVVLTVFLLTLCPRWVWMADGVEQMQLGTIRDGGRRRGYPSVEIQLTTEDGKQFLFGHGDFLGERLEWLQALLRLREVYGPDALEIRIDPRYTPEDVAQRRDYTAEEAELLYQLFEP